METKTAFSVIKAIALIIIVLCIVAITASMLMDAKQRRRITTAAASLAESNPIGYFDIQVRSAEAGPFSGFNSSGGNNDNSGPLIIG